MRTIVVRLLQKYGEAVPPVSYTHLDVYKRQVPAGGSSSSASDVHAASIRRRAQARDAAGGNME